MGNIMANVRLITKNLQNIKVTYTKIRLQLTIIFPTDQTLDYF